jgi:uroporphyrinogen-III decarboxylase
MQVSVREMFSDPTTLANSLQACQRLFKYDGTVILFDTTLEAEACGCQISWQEGCPPKVVSPVFSNPYDLATLDASEIEGAARIPVVIEATKRLTQTIGGEVSILGAITGPATLGRHLLGDAVLSACDTDSRAFDEVVGLWETIALARARAYGELNLDAIILVEEDFAAIGPSRYAAILPALKTLGNLARFYDMAVIAHTEAPSVRDLDGLVGLEVDGMSAWERASGGAANLPPGDTIHGVCVSSSALLGSAEDVRGTVLDLLSRSGRSRIFITSESEVPPATPAANLHGVMKALRDAAAK